MPHTLGELLRVAGIELLEPHQRPEQCGRAEIDALFAQSDFRLFCRKTHPQAVGLCIPVEMNRVESAYIGTAAEVGRALYIEKPVVFGF